MLDVGCLPRRSLTLTGNLMSGSMPSVWSLGNLTYVRRTHTRTTDAAGWADVGWCVSVGNEEAAWGVCARCVVCVVSVVCLLCAAGRCHCPTTCCHPASHRSSRVWDFCSTCAGDAVDKCTRVEGWEGREGARRVCVRVLASELSVVGPSAALGAYVLACACVVCRAER